MGHGPNWEIWLSPVDGAWKPDGMLADPHWQMGNVRVIESGARQRGEGRHENRPGADT